MFDETKSYWKDVIDISQAAAARIGRIKTSQATNPNFTLSDLGSAFSVGEAAAYIIVLGDRVSGTVDKTVVEYLFGKSSSRPPL